jgi:hypothetical protein
LLQLAPEEVPKFLSSLEKERDNLTKTILQICWYMRGGVTYDEAWRLDPKTRGFIVDLINDNIERTKTSGLPLL